MFEKRSMYDKLYVTNSLLKVIPQESDLQQEVARFGFDQARLDAGRSLMEQARDAQAEFHEVSGRNRGTRELLKTMSSDVRRSYMDTVILARRALFDKPDQLQSLDLVNPRESVNRNSRWIGQAWNFYKNLNDEVRVELERFGITSDQLTADEAALSTYNDALSQVAEGRSTYREIQTRRRAAFDLLDRWLGDLEAVLRIIVRDRPAWRIKLGLITRRPAPEAVPEPQSVPESQSA